MDQDDYRGYVWICFEDREKPRMASRFWGRTTERMELPFTEREETGKSRIGWVDGKEKGRAVAEIKNLSLIYYAYDTC